MLQCMQSVQSFNTCKIRLHIFFRKKNYCKGTLICFPSMLFPCMTRYKSLKTHPRHWFVMQQSVQKSEKIWLIPFKREVGTKCQEEELTEVMGILKEPLANWENSTTDQWSQQACCLHLLPHQQSSTTFPLDMYLLWTKNRAI